MMCQVRWIPLCCQIKKPAYWKSGIQEPACSRGNARKMAMEQFFGYRTQRARHQTSGYTARFSRSCEPGCATCLKRTKPKLEFKAKISAFRSNPFRCSLSDFVPRIASGKVTPNDP